MMARISLALLGASLLFTSACADEQKAETAQNLVAKSAAIAPIAFADSNPADWREPDLENTLYIKTVYGTFVVEMAPEFAPKHVEQIKTLTRQKFYDDITFHRVIDDFMNQTGDPRGDGTGDSDLPDIPAEFVFRREPSQIKVSITGTDMFTSGEAEVGFYKAFPIGTQSSSMAILTKDGKVNAWGIHCSSVTSMARGPDENSANSQFFLMRGFNTGLNQKYTVWGTTVWGREGLTKIKVGEHGKTENFVPDHMLTVRVAADVPENERIPVEIMRTDSRSFENYLNGMKTKAGIYPAICDIEVPTRLKR